MIHPPDFETIGALLSAVGPGGYVKIYNYEGADGDAIKVVASFHRGITVSGSGSQILDAITDLVSNMPPARSNPVVDALKEIGSNKIGRP